MKIDIASACLNKSVGIVIDGVSIYHSAAGYSDNASVIVDGAGVESDARLTLNGDTRVDVDALA